MIDPVNRLCKFILTSTDPGQCGVFDYFLRTVYGFCKYRAMKHFYFVENVENQTSSLDLSGSAD